MKKKEKDEKFAAHVPGVLEYHHLMLGDAVRNRLLASAIEQCVSPETSFLDVGAGSGVWAILAAKLGAKRVVAVEIEECLIPFIHKHAQENGVADKVEIVHGNSNDVKLRGKFDVVVSELFSSHAFGAETVSSFIDIRERFLAPGGTLIPEKLTMLARPVRIDEPLTPAGLDISTRFLAGLRLNYSRNKNRSEYGNITFLEEPKALVELDFRSIKEPPALTNLTAEWKMRNISSANGFATYNLSTFLDGVEMDSLDSQSWGLGLYEFVPFEGKRGTLQLSITMDAKNTNWTVSAPSSPHLRPQTYSPIFGFTRIRMAQQTTPHRKVRAKKREGTNRLKAD